MKAFPVQESVPQDDYYEGMDLRDYFAAKAMQSLISTTKEAYYKGLITDYSFKHDSERAYEVADEMMEARK